MRRVVVKRAEELSPTVRGFRLACADGLPFSFVAGQWINLHVAVDGGTDKRPYSIASAPLNVTDRQIITIKTGEANVDVAPSTFAMPSAAHPQ